MTLQSLPDGFRRVNEYEKKRLWNKKGAAYIQHIIDENNEEGFILIGENPDHFSWKLMVGDGKILRSGIEVYTKDLPTVAKTCLNVMDKLGVYQGIAYLEKISFGILGKGPNKSFKENLKTRIQDLRKDIAFSE